MTLLKIRRRNGWTLVEILIAMSLFTLVIGGVYGWLHLAAGQSHGSISSRTTLSYLRQDVRLGLEKLVGRLESSIEILSPEPGQSGGELIFRDLLNHDARVAHEPPTGELASYRREGASWVRETDVVSLTTEEGAAFQSPVQPLRIRECQSVLFRVYSPTLVSIELTLADRGAAGTLVTLVHLRNSQLLEN